MPGPGDALFLALAQAKAQPDRWARAVNEGANAGKNIISGYMGGKELKQQLDQYRLLATPLGSMYSDPTQIPFGLSPTHTVKDLLTLAPAMENFAPANLMSGVANMYGANTNPSPSSAPVARTPTQAPPPTLASASMDPIAGAENPAPPPGTTALNADEGTGAGAGANLPAGASPTVPSEPSLNIPPGGMGMGAFQKVVIPALNAAREGRQFQEGQANENTRSALSRQQQASQFATSQTNEKGRAVAAVAEKNAPILTGAAQLQTALTAMDNLNSDPANKSIPFSGNLGNWYANQNPNTQSKWALNQSAAEGWANVGAGAIEKMVEGRYNDEQMARIKASLFPTGNQLGTPKGNLMIQQLKSYVQQAKSGALNQVQASLDAIAGGGGSDIASIANPVTAPKTPTQMQQNPPNSSTGDPMADAAIQRVQQSSLDPASKQARIQGITAKARMKRSNG